MINPTYLTLRLATQDDVLDILHWRNEAFTRSKSRDTRIISEADHRQWFSKTLQHPQKLLLIGICEKQKVGMVRFDKCNVEQWEVSIIVNPRMREQGFGKQHLKLALKWLQNIYAPTSVVAVVNLNNEHSLKLFQKLGFNREKDNEDFAHFILNLTLA